MWNINMPQRTHKLGNSQLAQKEQTLETDIVHNCEILTFNRVIERKTCFMMNKENWLFRWNSNEEKVNLPSAA